jgi:hypothetical protein
MPQYLREQSLEDRVAALETLVATLQRTNAIGNTTLSNGQLVIRQGGRIVVMSAQDPTRVVARIGDVATPDANGTPQMGIQIYRDTPSNELAAASVDRTPGGGTGFPSQTFAIYDQAGSPVLATDRASGRGVASPWRPVAFSTVSYWSAPYSSLTTMAEVAGADVPTDGPRLDLGLAFIGDQVAAVNTGGSYQVLVGATVVASGTIPATFSYAYATLAINMVPYYAPGGFVRVSVQVQRTSGATTGGRDGAGGVVIAMVLGSNLRNS